MSTALITGATSALGSAFARRLASDGFDLVLVARDADRLAETTDGLRARHAVAIDALPADLSDPASRAVVESRLAQDGASAVTLLVNNETHQAQAEFADAGPAELQSEIDVNVTAVLQLTRVAVAAMIARGRGSVVNVASIAGYLPARGSAYGASKAWVLAFTDTVAASLAGTGVSAIAVCAGPIRAPGATTPTGPMSLDADDVVARCLVDLRRGRTMSTPGWVYRGLVGTLELPRRSLRLAARAAGRSRGQHPRAHANAAPTSNPRP